MQKMNRRKFLQLCAVGAVAAARWLVTGGKKTEIEQEENLIGAIEGKKIYSTTEMLEDTAPNLVEYELQKSIHYNFTEDRTAWRFKTKRSSPAPAPGPAFVILEPSEQMVKELEGLKAQSISILATYHD